MERTLILVKPDAMQRSLAGEVISRLERRGLKIVGMKLLHMDEALAKKMKSRKFPEFWLKKRSEAGF